MAMEIDAWEETKKTFRLWLNGSRCFVIAAEVT